MRYILNIKKFNKILKRNTSDVDEHLRQKMTYFQNSYINSVRLLYNIFINIIKSGGKELCKHYK